MTSRNAAFHDGALAGVLLSPLKLAFSLAFDSALSLPFDSSFSLAFTSALSLPFHTFLIQFICHQNA